MIVLQLIIIAVVYTDCYERISMNMIAFFRYGAMASTALLLAACVTTSPPASMPAAQGNWQALGVSASSNIKYELDKNSIRRQGNSVTFNDRKTVIDPKQQYYANTPAYKTAISTTQMNCDSKNFRILDVTLFDQNGEILREDHFSDTDLRPMGITNGSAAQEQYQQVCQVSTS